MEGGQKSLDPSKGGSKKFGLYKTNLKTHLYAKAFE